MGLAVGYSISWDESEKVRLEQRLVGGEGFCLQISGGVCFWQRKELKQRLQGKSALGVSEARGQQSGVGWVSGRGEK